MRKRECQPLKQIFHKNLSPVFQKKAQYITNAKNSSGKPAKNAIFPGREKVFPRILQIIHETSVITEKSGMKTTQENQKNTKKNSRAKLCCRHTVSETNANTAQTRATTKRNAACASPNFKNPPFISLPENKISVFIPFRHNCRKRGEGD